MCVFSSKSTLSKTVEIYSLKKRNKKEEYSAEGVGPASCEAYQFALPGLYP